MPDSLHEAEEEMERMLDAHFVGVDEQKFEVYEYRDPKSGHTAAMRVAPRPQVPWIDYTPPLEPGIRALLAFRRLL